MSIKQQLGLMILLGVIMSLLLINENWYIIAVSLGFWFVGGLLFFEERKEK